MEGTAEKNSTALQFGKFCCIVVALVFQICLLGFMYHLFGTEQINWENDVLDHLVFNEDDLVNLTDNIPKKKFIEVQEKLFLLKKSYDKERKVRLQLEADLGSEKQENRRNSADKREVTVSEVRKLEMKHEYANENFFVKLMEDIEKAKENPDLLDVIHQKVKRASEDLKNIDTGDIVKHRNGAFGLPPNRLICVVPGRYPGDKHQMETILKTWGSHCSKLIFTVISKEDNIPKFIKTDSFWGSNTPKKKLSAPIVVFNDTFRPEDGENLIEKMFRSFNWVYQNVDPLPDYIIKVDTDYFLMPENLEILMARHDPDDSVMFGNWLYHRPEITWKFPAGTYTLSRGALKKFSEFIQDALVVGHTGSTRFVRRGPCIDWPLHDDDLYIGMCCDQLNITMAYSKDDFGAEMFCPLGFEQCIGMRHGTSFWYTKNKENQYGENIDHFSAHPAAFHRVKQASEVMRIYKHLYIMSVKQGGPFSRL